MLRVFTYAALCAPLILAQRTEAQIAYTVSTVAGSAYTGDGTYATGAILSQPEGIAVDGLGNIYFADADDHRVRRISPGGIIDTVAGTGTPGFSGDGGPATAAQLNQPYGVAVDASGNLYIPDLGNARVRRVSAAGVISTYGAGLTLKAPRNVALDANGNLYISDFGAHQIFRVAPDGTGAAIAGTGKAGFAGDNGPAAAAQLSSPAGIAVDGKGAVYVADSGNGRIRKIASGIISSALTIDAPTGVALGPTGALYVAAAGYFGSALHPIAGVNARDMTVDASGAIYLTADSFVRRFGVDGQLTVVAGNGAARYYAGDGGPAAAGRFHRPSATLVDDLGNAYIADTGNHRIRKISAAGLLTTYAGTGTPGSRGDNGAATAAELNNPRALAIDSFRNLYVIDAGNNRLRKITAAGVITTITDGLTSPDAVAIGNDGMIYVADLGKNRIVKISTNGSISAIATADAPCGLTLDRAGVLYVSEATRVSKWSGAGALVPVAEHLQSPRGLTIGTDGALLIAERGSGRILSWTSNGGVTTFAGTGAPGFAGDGGAAVNAQFSGPEDVSADAAGNLWIADTGNSRIRKLTPAPGDVAAVELATPRVQNAASNTTGPVAPGEIVSIYGAGFMPGDTQVLFNGQPAVLFYSGTAQINALVPPSAAGSAVTLSIAIHGAEIARTSLSMTSAAPGIFTATGSGQAAATNQNGSYNSAANPAVSGSIVTLYATGMETASAPVTVTVGGLAAEVLYAGPAPSFAGLSQLNIRIPASLGGNVEVLVKVAGVSSQSGATVAVR